MKIIVAFDSFKGCITAAEACHTAAQAIHEVLPDAEVVECPLSDGGEGLVNCVKGMLDVHMVTTDAHDPLMHPIKASYAVSADGTTAYMEMAETSGLPLVPIDKRNPLLTTTYGVGDMIADATRRGCKRIIMGIGGSATCDAGMGMLNSLSDHGVEYDSVPEITVACDVTNPLYGESGAAYIFGPQKGASPEQVNQLDDRLRRIAHNQESIGAAKPEDADIPGAGAAGGLGYGLLTSLHATLKRGIDIVLDINHFDKLISDSTLIITGEGKSDAQTMMGKVPHGVLNHAKRRNIPVWLLSGCIDDDQTILSSHFTLVHSINEGDNRPLETLMQPNVAKKNIENTIKMCTMVFTNGNYTNK